MTAAVIDDLKRVPLFQGMTERAIEAVATLVTALSVADGQPIVAEGEPGDAFYLLVEGQVEVTRRGEPIRRLGAGDFIGEIALVDGRARTATATAVGPVRTLVVRRDAFLELMDHHPAVRLGILMALTDRIRSDGDEPVA
jgi:CRP-like cAMP-binding protein